MNSSHEMTGKAVGVESCRQRDDRELLAPGAWSCGRLRSRKNDIRWLEAWNKQSSVGDSDEHNNERGSGAELVVV